MFRPRDREEGPDRNTGKAGDESRLAPSFGPNGRGAGDKSQLTPSAFALHRLRLDPNPQ